jgi:hypothetical protein
LGEPAALNPGRAFALGIIRHERGMAPGGAELTLKQKSLHVGQGSNLLCRLGGCPFVGHIESPLVAGRGSRDWFIDHRSKAVH